MKNKKANKPKLNFFSDSNIENLENEMDAVIKLVKDGRISFRNGMIRLHKAKDDIMQIFWHISCKIAEKQKEVYILEAYQQMKHEPETDEQLQERIVKDWIENKVSDQEMEVKRIDPADDLAR